MAEPKTDRVTTLRLGAGGELNSARVEGYALALADGFDRTEAWEIAALYVPGKKVAGRESRLAYERQAAFKERVAGLERERSRMAEMGEAGEALWAAKQTWRVARLAGDMASMTRMAELQARLSEKLLGDGGGGSEKSNPSGSTSGEGGARAGPGRPAKVLGRAQESAGSIRKRLLGMGVPTPVEDDDEDVEEVLEEAAAVGLDGTVAPASASS